LSQSSESPIDHSTIPGFGVATPTAQGASSREIAGFLDDIEQAGIELHALLVWRDGAIVAQGYRWPYAADRPRILHSVAKSFTACAIGLLIEEGRLSIHDRVAQFFPEIDIGHEQKCSRMTIEDLLTMRTGHSNEVSGARWRGIATSWVNEFFNIPVEHEPGTTYVYTSAASYMLSAIVTRVTGETIHAYLKPRLFEPLGIENERWDIGPDGINPGGNGITALLTDMLKLGILHAQAGVWEGKRILPASWVEQATQPQGSEAYGYHWVIGADYFAALGQFVQAVFVYPDHRGAIVVAGAMQDSKVLLPHLWRRFPQAFAGADGAVADAALADRLAKWRAPDPIAGGVPDVSRLVGRRWIVEPNDLGVTELAFDRAGDDLLFSLTDAEGTHHIPIGAGRWIEGRSSIPGAALHHGYRLLDAPAITGAWWSAGDRFTMVWHFVESAFRDTVDIRLDGDRLTFDRRTNINSSATSWPTLSATQKA
jgi:CubicO group peptidase (beta-lactamase class C family)